MNRYELNAQKLCFETMEGKRVEIDIDIDHGRINEMDSDEGFST